MEMLKDELCIRCQKSHVYFKTKESEIGCGLERNLLAEFEKIKVSGEENKKAIDKALKSIKVANWKDGKLKMEIDDAIQANNNTD